MFSCHGVEGPAGLAHTAKPEPGAILSAEGLHGRADVAVSFGWGTQTWTGTAAGQGCCAMMGLRALQ